MTQNLWILNYIYLPQKHQILAASQQSHQHVRSTEAHSLFHAYDEVVEYVI